MARWNIAREIAARCVATDVALIGGEEQQTYGQLFQQAEAIARGLWAELSGAEGQVLRLGLHYPSGVHYVPVALGMLLADACFVPIPSELSGEEKLALVRSTSLHGIVAAAGDELAWLPEDLRASCAVLDQAQGGVLWQLRALPAAFPEAEFAALNPAFIRFSSGTTGQSKGIVLSHESLLARITSANLGLGMGRGERVLWVLPMAHHFAVSIMP